MRNLVFVHGRGQQGREADALRRRWAAGLNKGLTAAGRAPLGTGEIDAIEFPFYGDVLWAEVVQARAAVPDVAALDAVQQVDPGLPDAVTAGMRPAGAARPASPWVNMYDPRDWATLGSPLPRGGGLGEQLAVANPRSQEHSIEHYLAHPEVATVIADHLGHAPARGRWHPSG